MTTTRRELTTPFSNDVPPLTTEEFASLQHSIKHSGQIYSPIIVTENDEILDGHHRYKIAMSLKMSYPVTVIRGTKNWTDEQKRCRVIQFAMETRNLSPSQKHELDKMRNKIIIIERKTNKTTQKDLGIMFGLSKSQISRILEALPATGTTSKPNGKPNKRSGAVSNPTTDVRVKVNPTAKPVIAERVAAGEPQAQVAADFGVSQRTISTIVRAEEKQETQKQERVKAAKKIKTDCGVLHGDFRKQDIAPNSVAMIFTDPPYDEESAALYDDLAEFSANVLMPGGWVLAYSGQVHLPQVLASFANHPNLKYAWTFACVHSGGDMRFRKYKLHNGWKPIVAAYKPPLTVDWEYMKDVVSGGREKDDHEWQQSESEASHCIAHVCPEGGTVCDPFAGSGTTLSAAKALKRKWLGIEIDEKHVVTARIRLQD